MFGFEKLKKERPSIIEQRDNSEQLFDTSNKKPGRLSIESENKNERDWTWPDIGSLTEFDNAGYAEAMCRLAMDTGNECYATVGIAIMMEHSNPKRAASRLLQHN